MFTLDPTSWSLKELIAQRTRQPDYNALTLSLSHRSLTVGYYIAPGGSALVQIRGAYMPGRETALRLGGGIPKIPIGHRVVDQSHAIS